MSHTEDRVARPLVATADEALLDELLRLAAAAGTTPEVVHDAGAARRAWSTAGIVVVGDDLAAALAAARPPRRDGVVVVGSAARASEVDRAGGDATPSSTPPDFPAGPTTASSVWPHAVAVGADDVVWLPDREADLIERLGACVDGAGRGMTVAVVGGSGGCGASTFAAGLALAAGDRGLGTLLIDADPLGGGLDLHVGDDGPDGMRWADLATASGRIAATALREALPRIQQVSVLSWGRGDPDPVPVESMGSVLAAGQRGHDLVVVDLPRRPDPVAAEVLAGADHTLLLVRGDVVSVAAARRVRRTLAATTHRIGLVVVDAGPTGIPGDLVAETLEIPLVATMRPDRRIARALADGLGPLRRRRGPLAATCRGVLDELGVSVSRVD